MANEHSPLPKYGDLSVDQQNAFAGFLRAFAVSVDCSDRAWWDIPAEYEGLCTALANSRTAAASVPNNDLVKALEAVLEHRAFHPKCNDPGCRTCISIAVATDVLAKAKAGA